MHHTSRSSLSSYCEDFRNTFIECSSLRPSTSGWLNNMTKHILTNITFVFSSWQLPTYINSDIDSYLTEILNSNYVRYPWGNIILLYKLVSRLLINRYTTKMRRKHKITSKSYYFILHLEYNNGFYYHITKNDCLKIKVFFTTDWQNRSQWFWKRENANKYEIFPICVGPMTKQIPNCISQTTAKPVVLY